MIKLNSQDIKLLNISIEQGKKFIILTHSNPDGDTVGASLALGGTLRKLNKVVLVLSPDVLPDFLQWIPQSQSIRSIPDEEPDEDILEAFAQADTLFCMDFNAAHRTGRAVEKLANSFEGKKIMIDHHLFPDEEFFDLLFSYPEASSTSELLFHILKATTLDRVTDRDIALALAVGIITDTGSFAHNCDRPEVFDAMSELITKHGISVKSINEKIYKSFSANRLRFLGYCLSEKLHVRPEKKAAYIWVSMEEMKRFKVNEGDLEGIVNYALSLKEVVFAVLLKEKPGVIKLSFRSKDNFSVNTIAREHFRGGGHLNASGGKSFKNMADTLSKLNKIIDDLDI